VRRGSIDHQLTINLYGANDARHDQDGDGCAQKRNPCHHCVWIHSTQVVVHHFSQSKRQVRDAVQRGDDFQDGQLGNGRQCVGCE
jgi:hypothetical protein